MRLTNDVTNDARGILRNIDWSQLFDGFSYLEALTVGGFQLVASGELVLPPTMSTIKYLDFSMSQLTSFDSVDEYHFEFLLNP